MTSIEQTLISANLFSSEALNHHRLLAEKQRTSLIVYLADNHILQEKTLTSLLSKHFNLPIIPINDIQPLKPNLSLMPLTMIKKWHILPLKQCDGKVKILLTDPSNIQAIKQLQLKTFCPTEICLISFSPFKRLITKIETDELQTKIREKTPLNPCIHHSDDPIVNYINSVVEQALLHHASDIHFEPYAKCYRIRLRKDGVLHELNSPPTTISQQLTARLKIMAKLNTTEKRIPQDGCFQLSLKQQTIDFRISTCPTTHGEKIVLRILNKHHIALDINKLGLNQRQKKLILDAIHQPTGLVLVTGPTGSGKTTTLYSALKQINTVEKNISSAEDPVEISLPGINQVNINPKLDFHFSTALRAFLRQDPDIIMIGEIRDNETAQIAIKAAQTGHLVLSTLHSTNTLSAITRLQHMNVALFDTIESTKLIVAQRLIRKLCVFCKVAHPITTLQYKKFNLSRQDVVFKATGCQHCHNGYDGRTAIYEMLSIPETLQQQTDLNAANIQQILREHLSETLQQAAIEKLKAGVISITEMDFLE